MTVVNTFVDGPVSSGGTSSKDTVDTLNFMAAAIKELQGTVLRPITIGFMGDSNAFRYIDDGAGTPNDKVTFSTDGTTFSKLTKGRFAMDLGNKLVAATGRPVRFLHGGVSGTTAGQWEQPGGIRDPFVNQLKNAGRCDLVMSVLGFNDVNQGGTFTYTSQLGLLRRVYANIRAASGYPDLRFMLATSQDVSGNLDTLAFERMAEMTIATTDTNFYLGYNCYDLPTFDSIHLTEPGLGTAANRAYPQAMSVLTGSAQVRGPRVTAIAAVSATQTRVTLAHGAGTDFIPSSGITGFVIAQGSSKLAISAAVRESATSILLTHATTGGASAYIYYSPAGVLADNATVVHDNGSLALPLELSASPIEIIPVGGTATPPPVQSFTYGPQSTTDSGRFDTGNNRPIAKIITNGSGGLNIDVGINTGNTIGYRVENLGDTFAQLFRYKPDGSKEQLSGGDGSINLSQYPAVYNSSTGNMVANAEAIVTVDANGLLRITANGTTLAAINPVNTGYPDSTRGTYAGVRSLGGAVTVTISPT